MLYWLKHAIYELFCFSRGETYSKYKPMYVCIVTCAVVQRKTI